MANTIYIFENSVNRERFFSQNPDKLFDGVGCFIENVSMFMTYIERNISGNPEWVNSERYYVGRQGEIGGTGAPGPQGTQGNSGFINITPKGEWTPDRQYFRNDLVGYNGIGYICIQNISGTVSPDLDSVNWFTATINSEGEQGVQGPHLNFRGTKTPLEFNKIDPLWKKLDVVWVENFTTANGQNLWDVWTKIEDADVEESWVNDGQVSHIRGPQGEPGVPGDAAVVNYDAIYAWIDLNHNLDPNAHPFLINEINRKQDIFVVGDGLDFTANNLNLRIDPTATNTIRTNLLNGLYSTITVTNTQQVITTPSSTLRNHLEFFTADGNLLTSIDIDLDNAIHAIHHNTMTIKMGNSLPGSLETFTKDGVDYSVWFGTLPIWYNTDGTPSTIYPPLDYSIQNFDGLPSVAGQKSFFTLSYWSNFDYATGLAPCVILNISDDLLSAPLVNALINQTGDITTSIIDGKIKFFVRKNFLYDNATKRYFDNVADFLAGVMEQAIDIGSGEFVFVQEEMPNYWGWIPSAYDPLDPTIVVEVEFVHAYLNTSDFIRTTYGGDSAWQFTGTDMIAMQMGLFLDYGSSTVTFADFEAFKLDVEDLLRDVVTRSMLKTVDGESLLMDVPIDFPGVTYLTTRDIHGPYGRLLTTLDVDAETQAGAIWDLIGKDWFNSKIWSGWAFDPLLNPYPNSMYQYIQDSILGNFYTKAEINTQANTYVKLAGAQTITGSKTFSALPICSYVPTSINHLVNKLYVDNKFVGTNNYDMGTVSIVASNSKASYKTYGNTFNINGSNVYAEFYYDIRNIGSTDGNSCHCNINLIRIAGSFYKLTFNWYSSRDKERYWFFALMGAYFGNGMRAKVVGMTYTPKQMVSPTGAVVGVNDVWYNRNFGNYDGYNQLPNSLTVTYNYGGVDNAGELANCINYHVLYCYSAGMFYWANSDDTSKGFIITYDLIIE